MAQDPKVAMESLRAAIRLRDGTSVHPGEVELLVRSAADIEPGSLGLAPVRFLVAQNLLRRKNINDWSDALIQSIAELAARDSTNPGFFADPDNKTRLALALRGSKFAEEPVSWWEAQPGISGRGERSELGDVHVTPVFKDNTSWLDSLEFERDKWGFELAVFTVGMVPEFGR